MKLIKNIVLPFIVFSIFIISCNKDALEFETNQINIEESQDNNSFKTDCSILKLNGTVEEILADKNDSENHKINMILYHYAKSLTEVVKEKELLCNLTDKMLDDKFSYGVSISELANTDEVFKAKLNESLKNSISKKSIYPANQTEISTLLKSTDWEADTYLKANFTYKKEQYEPSIYFIQAPKYCDANAKVNILIAEEANECDDVVGWSNGKIIFMSEAEIMKSNDINIFVGVSNLDKKKKGYRAHDIVNRLNNQNTSNAMKMMKIDLTVDEHQIKNGYRYDSNKRSEVRTWVIQYFADQVGKEYEFGWPGFSGRKIHKDDINSSKLFTEDRDAFEVVLADFDNNIRAFIGSFEYDWYASYKDVTNPEGTHPYHSVKVKMKYDDEWYFSAVDDVQDWFPIVDFNQTFENEKCKFKLKRVQ